MASCTKVCSSPCPTTGTVFNSRWTDKHDLFLNNLSCLFENKQTKKYSYILQDRIFLDFVITLTTLMQLYFAKLHSPFFPGNRTESSHLMSASSSRTRAEATLEFLRVSMILSATTLEMNSIQHRTHYWHVMWRVISKNCSSFKIQMYKSRV